MHLYVAQEQFGRFPGFRFQATDGGSPAIGWAAQLFSFLGRGDLDPTQSTFIETLVCPSDSGPRDSARMNYVVNGGQADIDSVADGIFFDHAKPVAERVYIMKEDFRDGLTNTILLAENLDATEWTNTDETNQCILWPLTSGNEVNNGVGGAENVSRPSSHHPGGFVTAFADGSVKFMNEQEINDDANVHTENSVYVALLTPGGQDAGALGSGEGGSTEGPSAFPECGACDTSANLVAHYPLDEDDPAEDISGNGHHGQMFGSPVYSSERGGCMLFNGTSDYIDVPDEILNHDAGTVSLWMRTTTFSVPWNDRKAFSNQHSPVQGSNVADRLYIGIDAPAYAPTGNSGNFHVAFDKVKNESDHQLVLDQWHHVVVVWCNTAGKAQAYVDGQMVYENDDVNYTNMQYLVNIGSYHEGLRSYWQGYIDDVRVYDCALGPSQFPQ